MIKMNERRLDRGLEANPCGHAFWALIGSRIRARRTHLGLDIEHVAGKLGVSTSAYGAFESGNQQLPASLLGQIADLFGVPVVWFCQDVAFDTEEDADVDAASEQPAVFSVATVEQRVQSLADAFRGLDLEGQQHLLAIAGALSRSNGKEEPD